MADDWKPGDKGICINGGSWGDVVFGFLVIPTHDGPQKGDIVTVNCVHPSPYPDLPTLFLGLREYPVSQPHYDAAHFRKIPPSSEEHVNALKNSIKEPVNVS